MEHPILFSTPMVQAILEGRKSQTRRMVKFKYLPEIGGSYGERVMIYGKSGTLAMYCPYGRSGDILWVREMWRIAHINHTLNIGDFFVIQFKNYSTIKIDQELLRNKFYEKPYEIGSIGDAYSEWRPSIFMPKVASRIKLEITNIKVEKLCDITEEDVMAEGISLPNYAEQAIKDVYYPEPSDIYAELWDKINGTGSWIKNPWVWVIEFKVKARSKYVKGQFIETIISGHYQIIAEEKNYLLLKDEDIEIPVAKRNIIKFEAVNNTSLIV